MIATALGLELRALLRSRGRLLALLAFLGLGVLALWSGRAHVERWEGAIQEARAEEAESLSEARGWLEAGASGPEDRPWVDLSQPRWQDSYAATRMMRAPSDLAGIAFAAAEDGPLAMRVYRGSDPLLAAGSRVENPELAHAGGLDLVSVLTLLLPLLVLALGLEVGGYERATGLQRLVQVQSGRDRSWIVARAIAVGLIGTAAALALCVLAAVWGGTAGALTLVALTLVYGAVWTAALAAVAVRAQHPAQGAVSLGVLWILVCVIAPAIGVERSAALAADDFGVELSVEARDASYALSGVEASEARDRLLERFPEFADSPYALAEEPPRSAGRAVGDGLRLLELEARAQTRVERDAAQTTLLDRLAWGSPALALTRALEGLGGRGAEAAAGFRDAVQGATTERVRLLLEHTFRLERVGAEEFETLVSAVPGEFRWQGGLPGRELGVLLSWALGLGLLARFAPRRGAVA